MNLIQNIHTSVIILENRKQKKNTNSAKHRSAICVQLTFTNEDTMREEATHSNDHYDATNSG